MSTRGTYLVRVQKKHEQRVQFFYNHCDNYPAGAAELIEAALKLEWKHQVHGKNLIKRLAALDGPEFINCHEDHGDTEFRYEIIESDEFTDISVLEVDRNNLSDWKEIFEGTLEEFLIKFLRKKDDEDEKRN